MAPCRPCRGRWRRPGRSGSGRRALALRARVLRSPVGAWRRRWWERAPRAAVERRAAARRRRRFDRGIGRRRRCFGAPVARRDEDRAARHRAVRTSLPGGKGVPSIASSAPTASTSPPPTAQGPKEPTGAALAARASRTSSGEAPGSSSSISAATRGGVRGGGGGAAEAPDVRSDFGRRAKKVVAPQSVAATSGFASSSGEDQRRAARAFDRAEVVASPGRARSRARVRLPSSKGTAATAIAPAAPAWP